MDQDQGELTVSTSNLVLVQELQKAESEIIKLVQRTTFAAEIKFLLAQYSALTNAGKRQAAMIQKRELQ